MMDRFWRALPLALAIGFAARAFGLIGAVIVGVLGVAFWRWRKPQVIASWCMAVVLFTAVVLLQGRPAVDSAWVANAQWRAATSAKVVTTDASTAGPWSDYTREPGAATQPERQATSTPPVDAPHLSATPPSASAQSQWEADVTAFIVAHPDVRSGSNIQLWTWYAQSLADKRGTWSNANILNAAYAGASTDPRWQH